MENIKLDDNELKKISEIRDKANRISMDLGRIELSRLSLDKKKDQILSTVQDLEKEENIFMEVLKSKYGNGTIDLEKGEFIKQ